MYINQWAIEVAREHRQNPSSRFENLQDFLIAANNEGIQVSNTEFAATFFGRYQERLEGEPPVIIGEPIDVDFISATRRET